MLRSALFILLIALCSGLVSCRQTAMPSVPVTVPVADSMLHKLHTGDIVLRTGKDEISHFFARLNQSDQQFSHCGIAVVSDSGIWVAHISAGDMGQGADFRYEPLASFIAASRNTGWAVKRPPLTALQQQAIPSILAGYAHAHVGFDSRFDLATDSLLYCSEMVYKALLAAGVSGSVFHISVAGTGRPYVGVDDLYINNRCATICQIVY